MHKFSFRLQRVLDYRELVEGWAKDAYLDARAQRLGAEGVLADLRTMRTATIQQSILNLDDRKALEIAVQRMDDEERAQLALISTLVSEEEHLLADWFLRRREVQALVKLREHAAEEWQYESEREEQSALDEWTITRRAA